MEKTFEGYLFNRIEKIGNKKYNHIGCEGDNENFGKFLSQFVPDVGTRRKVTFTAKAQEDIEKIKDYKSPKNYVEREKDGNLKWST